MKTKIHFAPNYFLQNLHRISVCIIGAGGNGSYMAHYLGKLHKALVYQERKGLNITIIDGDLVEESNTLRQLFSANDIGSHKSIALATQLSRAYGVSTTPITHYFNSKNINPMANIYVICVDSAKAREEIYSIIKKNKKSPYGDAAEFYVLDLGNTKNTGQVILGTLQSIKQPISSKYSPVSNLPTLIDIEPNLSQYDTEKIQGPSCSTQIALAEQDLFINAQMALTASQMLWKLLNEDCLFYAQSYVNLETGFTIPKNL